MKKQCLVCSKDYQVRPSRQSSYCSKRCHILAQRNNSPYPQMRLCVQCGHKFEIKSGRYKNRKFCSQTCSAKNSNAKRTGIRYRKDRPFKSKLIDKFGHQCFICGYDKIVHGHHIIEKSCGGTDEVDNGVLLCPNHHAELHKDLLSEGDRLKLEGLVHR